MEAIEVEDEEEEMAQHWKTGASPALPRTETTKEGLQGQAQSPTREGSCIGRGVRQRELPEKRLRRRKGKKQLQKMKLLQPGQQRKRKNSSR